MYRRKHNSFNFGESKVSARALPVWTYYKNEPIYIALIFCINKVNLENLILSIFFYYNYFLFLLSIQEGGVCYAGKERKNTKRD